MKTKYTLGLFSAFFFSLEVSAKPWHIRHSREHEQDKRDVFFVYTTVVKTYDSQGTNAPDVVVHVAVNGDRTTVTQGAEIESIRAKNSEPTPIKLAAPQIENDQPTHLAKDQSIVPSGDSNAETAEGQGWGFSYAPFKGDGSCKGVDEIKRDFEKVGKEYSLVRIYGTSCNQVETVLAVAQNHNLQIFAGIFDINQVETEIKLIIAAAKNDWARFDTISIGNEVVNSTPDDQKASVVAKVVAAIRQARSILKTTGFKGKIVTVDTLVAARAFPSLCEASDYCAVNCHPFFDGNVKADAAGRFISEQITSLAKVIPKSQMIVVTETGWPCMLTPDLQNTSPQKEIYRFANQELISKLPGKGLSNKAAVPSLANQEQALASIKDVFQSKKSQIVLFTIYNDYWKKNTAATFGAEQFWGIKGADAPSG